MPSILAAVICWRGRLRPLRGRSRDRAADHAGPLLTPGTAGAANPAL